MNETWQPDYVRYLDRKNPRLWRDSSGVHVSHLWLGGNHVPCRRCGLNVYGSAHECRPDLMGKHKHQRAILRSGRWSSAS